MLAFLVTLFGGFHLIENWRGKVKWEAYKRQLIAQGAKLDLAAFIPPPIPDSENFAATPFFASLFPGPPPTNWTDRWPLTIDRLRATASSGKKNERHITDLAGMQFALRAQNRQDTNGITGDRAQAAKELLAAMKMYELSIEELRAASARPRARYNVKYDLDNPWGTLIPHVGAIKRVCQDLSLKACAELAAGNSEGAMADIRLMARLTRSMDDELFLITFMVKVACLQFAVQPIWEGLAFGQWSDGQLEELQRMMMGFDFVNDMAKPLGVEQASGILTGEIFLREKKRAQLFNALFNAGGQSPFANLFVSLIPRGWFYQEQYNCARLFQEFVWPGFDPTNRVIDARVSDYKQETLDKVLTAAKHPILSHMFFAKQLLPAVGNAHRKAAHAQTAAHQAAIACALERYRRKYGD
ncbi:MAG TPA: hypothetical protein VK850_16470, partial [Candidatus Binatia bacterium]|nr:hypothetical protein [Candidatus Binatia bacterium]